MYTSVRGLEKTLVGSTVVKTGNEADRTAPCSVREQTSVSGTVQSTNSLPSRQCPEYRIDHVTKEPGRWSLLISLNQSKFSIRNF